MTKLCCRAGLLVCAMLALACNQSKQQHTMGTTAYAFRLKPGQDLRQGINQLVTEKQIKAGWVGTCVGSLTAYNLRFANQPGGSTGNGHFEIVGLTGTVSVNGSHLHLAISDSTGRTIGGHLLQGCKIYTTAEIVIQCSDDFVFTREKDGSTPWEELQVREQ
jgi:uncharacterized protein